MISDYSPPRKLSVLMPVFNESRTLRTIVSRVLAAPIALEIELLCVDDGSTDGSLEVLNELASRDQRIRVFGQPTNLGKGMAIRTAIENMSGDVAIIQDADLEYDPNDYPRLVGPILNGDADAVYGSRFAASEVRRVLFFWHALGNRILTTMSNMFNDLNLTDMETCYKAVRADVLSGLRLTSDRFGFEPEITARLAQSGARIYEVPVSYYGRTYAEGKNIGWRDGVEALWLIFKFRFIDNKATKNPGHLTLESLGLTPAVSRWMMENFVDHLGDNVLEAGAGSGNITKHLLKKRSVTAIDIDPTHIKSLERKFGHLENLTLEISDLEHASTYLRDQKFDSALCVNVLEHLDRPDAAIQGFYDVLKPGGHALILVPAHQWLFSAADEALGHRARYSVREVEAILEGAGFELTTCFEFNRLGVLGWYVNKLLGRTTITRLQARAFGLLLPVARIVERIGWLPGLSVIAVAKKP